MTPDPVDFKASFDQLRADALRERTFALGGVTVRLVRVAAGGKHPLGRLLLDHANVDFSMRNRIAAASSSPAAWRLEPKRSMEMAALI